MYVLLIIAIYSDSCVEKTLIYYPHITKVRHLRYDFDRDNIRQASEKALLLALLCPHPRSGGRIMHPEDSE